MLLAVENSTLISRMLFEHSDETHVDFCEWEYDASTGTGTAVFVSERFAKCMMTKHFPSSEAQISEDEIVYMASYATAELGRQLDELGNLSLFNLSTGTSPQELNDGMSFKIEYEDDATSMELTDESAWMAYAAS